jgi:6-phosphofructokinase 1
VPLDAAGHPRLVEVPLARMLTDELMRRFNERREIVTVIPQTIGYMLRCAPPTPLDMAYCRELGNGAVRLLLDESCDLTDGVMVTIQSSNLVPMKFSEMIDPDTNRTRIRQVDVNSDGYRVARAYMIRLESSDLNNPVMLAKLAAAAKMNEADFKKKFMRAATRLHQRGVDSLNVNIPPPQPQSGTQKSIK